jgi:putative ABC transport system substrate-binding protein
MMARRAAFAIFFTISLLSAALTDAQTAAKKRVVGVLGVTPTPPANHEMFKQGVAQLGHTEGQHVLFVEQHAGGVPVQLPAAAAELVRARPDVIFARGPAAVVAAVQATKTIPIVAVDLESDPIAMGFAKSLPRPGGNVTGVFLDLPELSAKQLQLFREIVPNLSRVALLGDPHDNAAQLRAAERAAKTFGGARRRAGRRATKRSRRRPHLLVASRLRPARAHRRPRP